MKKDDKVLDQYKDNEKMVKKINPVKEFKTIIPQTLAEMKEAREKDGVSGVPMGYSDLDLLLVMKEELTREEKNAIRNSLAFQFFDYNFNVDLIIASKSYIQKYKSISGTIIKPASESGKIIWKKHIN